MKKSSPLSSESEFTLDFISFFLFCSPRPISSFIPCDCLLDSLSLFCLLLQVSHTNLDTGIRLAVNLMKVCVYFSASEICFNKDWIEKCTETIHSRGPHFCAEESCTVCVCKTAFETSSERNVLHVSLLITEKPGTQWGSEPEAMWDTPYRKTSLEY